MVVKLVRILALPFISSVNETRGCAEVAPATVVVLAMPLLVTVSLLTAALNSEVQGSSDGIVKMKALTAVSPEFFFRLPLSF